MPTTTYRYAVRDSLRKLRIKLGLRKPLPAPEPAAPSHQVYHDVGFADAIGAGWFNHAKQELFTGFPITGTDTVIDVGCGHGGNLKFCANYAKRAIGIDISPDRVQSTRSALEQAGIKDFDVIQSDGNPLPIASNTIDKIVCTEVLEHVDDPQLTMGELVRIGKPGALYMLSVPGQASENIMKAVAHPACFEKPNHIRVFSDTDFEDLVKSSGLIIERHEYFSFYWAVWHALVWTSATDYDSGTHPVLDAWAQTWRQLSDLPDGRKCIAELDKALHKSQIIIARKPI